MVAGYLAGRYAFDARGAGKSRFAGHIFLGSSGATAGTVRFWLAGYYYGYVASARYSGESGYGYGFASCLVEHVASRDVAGDGRGGQVMAGGATALLSEQPYLSADCTQAGRADREQI